MRYSNVAIEKSIQDGNNQSKIAAALAAADGNQKFTFIIENQLKIAELFVPNNFKKPKEIQFLSMILFSGIDMKKETSFLYFDLFLHQSNQNSGLFKNNSNRDIGDIAEENYQEQQEDQVNEKF